MNDTTTERRDWKANEQGWNAEVIAEFRANEGVVAAPYDDPPLFTEYEHKLKRTIPVIRLDRRTA